MATAIRLQRGGRTHEPYYRIVVMDSRARNRGPQIDAIGVYHPCARPNPTSEVDVQKALYWLRSGAKPSQTARDILSRLGIMKHFHEGTTPEESVAQVKGAEVEQAGYNAPPPVVEQAAPEASESPASSEAEATAAGADGSAAATVE